MTGLVVGFARLLTTLFDVAPIEPLLQCDWPDSPWRSKASSSLLGQWAPVDFLRFVSLRLVASSGTWRKRPYDVLYWVNVTRFSYSERRRCP